jgi:hypothetical protein
MSVNESVNSFDKFSEKTSKFLKNNYVQTIIFVLAILYGSLIAPKLPMEVMKVIKHPIFLLVALVLIAFLTTQNKKVAVIVGVALAITLIFVSSSQTEAKVQQYFVEMFTNDSITSNTSVSAVNDMLISMPSSIPVSVNTVQPGINMEIKSNMLDEQLESPVYMVPTDNRQTHNDGINQYNDFGMMFDPNDKTPEVNQLDNLCIKGKCIGGFEKNNLANISMN